MEDAAVLADAIAEHRSDLVTALARFQAIRRPLVARIQDSAMPSLSWWDHFGEYYRALPPWQFAFHFFSRAISAEKIRARDPLFVAESERAWIDRHGANPVDTPLQIGAATLGTRWLQVSKLTETTLQLGDGAATLTASSDETLTRSAEPVLPLYTAPELESTSLDDSKRSELDRICAHQPAGVVVRGGTALSRALSSEYVRFTYRIPVIVVDQPSSVRARRAVDERDNAATLVLSGRADAVALEPDATVPHADSLHAEVAQ
jgi:hypothetical protein